MQPPRRTPQATSGKPTVAAPSGTPRRQRSLDPLRLLLPDRNPAGLVYGTVTVGALLAAESGLRDTYPETVGALAIAVLLYWFAHSYADVLGLRLSEQRLLSWGELWHTFVQDWAIVRGALAPALAVVIAWAAGAPQATGVAAGTWTAVASLVAFELGAAARSRARPAELLIQVTVGATLGLAILALRAVLH